MNAAILRMEESKMIDDQRKALVELAAAIVDVVHDAGSTGVPAGHMYATVMGSMSLASFERLMSVVVASGKVRKSGHCYYAV